MKVIIYEDKFGFSPFNFWLESLDDKLTTYRILARIRRINDGNLGDHKHLRESIWELRFKFSPGIRVYFAKQHDEIVLILIGGNKDSQTRDILKAVSFYRKYLESKL